MPITLADAAGGFALPALVAGIVLLLLRRYAPLDGIKQNAASIALVAGFLVGYWVLDLGSWSPKFHWHWLPYVALLSLLPGLIGSNPVWPAAGDNDKRRVIGAVTCLLVTLCSAWLLVPTWPHLEPSRTVHIAVWTVGVFALAMTLAPLGSRLPGAILPCVLAATMLAAAVLILLSESLKFSQIAGAAAGSMLGIAIVRGAGRQTNGSRALAPAFAILISGLLLVAQTDSFSSVPLISYALIPLAPLGLWVVAIPRIDKMRGWRRWLALSALPLLTLVIAIGLAAWMTLS